MIVKDFVKYLNIVGMVVALCGLVLSLINIFYGFIVPLGVVDVCLFGMLFVSSFNIGFELGKQDKED